jgi:hypothetical protein
LKKKLYVVEITERKISRLLEFSHSPSYFTFTVKPLLSQIIVIDKLTKFPKAIYVWWQEPPPVGTKFRKNLFFLWQRPVLTTSTAHWKSLSICKKLHTNKNLYLRWNQMCHRIFMLLCSVICTNVMLWVMLLCSVICTNVVLWVMVLCSVICTNVRPPYEGSVYAETLKLIFELTSCQGKRHFFFLSLQAAAEVEWCFIYFSLNSHSNYQAAWRINMCN